MSVKLISHSTAPVDSELDNVQDLVAYCAKVSNPQNQINKENLSEIKDNLSKLVQSSEKYCSGST